MPALRQDRLPITAAVLAGGRSTRMGQEKTLLPVDGVPLIVRVVSAVLEVCADAVVVTNQPDVAARAGLPDSVAVVRDEIAYQGPLGGLATALGVARQPWVLAVAADMPWLEPGVARVLWEEHADADVVIPVSEKGVEPLLALYRVETCLAAARETLRGDRRRIVAMFGGLRVAEVPVERLAEVDPELRSLVNVNTAEDLAKVRSEADLG